MYNDEELMLFAESYQKMQRKGTAGKKIIGTVSERLNESIDSQIKSAKLKKMVKALLECEKMKSAKKFLKSISLTECKAKDFAKVEKLYKLYEEIEEDDGDIIEISVPSIYHEPDEAKKLIKQFKKKYNVDAEFYDGGDQYSSWTFSGKRENLKKLFNGYFETTKDDDDEELATCVLDDDDVPLLKKILEAEDDIEEAEDDEAEGDPDVAVIKSGFISDYKSDKLSLYKFLQAIVEFGQWIMTHGKNEERNVMKSLLAVLEDEFIPKFAELPGATDDSTVDDEPADDADEEIPADAEADDEADAEDDTEDDDVDIDVDAEIDAEDDEADAEDDEEVEEAEEEIEEADDEVDEESQKAAFDILKDEKILDVLFSLKNKHNVLFISDDIEMSTDDFEECESLHAEMICEKSKLKSIVQTIKTEFEKLMPEQFKKAVDGDALWLTTKPIDKELLGDDDWTPRYYSDDDDDDSDYSDDDDDKSLNSDWYYTDTDEVKEHFKLKTDKAIINKLVLLCVGFEYAYNNKNLFA